VYFIDGFGINYPHPDVDAYQIEPWDNGYITGTELIHRHWDEYTSDAIALLPAVTADAAIGVLIGGGMGVVVGAVLASAAGIADMAILLDETDCIWTWESKTWGLKWFWIPPGLSYVPDYFRVAQYTLWDDIGVGNP